MAKKNLQDLKSCRFIKLRNKNYSSAIAVAGHSLAHVQQLTHFEESISRCPPFSLIAPTGQSGSHVPQFTHEFGSIL